jgi:hypothetical protein
MEGVLSKKGRMTWKRRYFILQDSKITYFAKKDDGKIRGQILLNAQVSPTAVEPPRLFLTTNWEGIIPLSADGQSLFAL